MIQCNLTCFSPLSGLFFNGAKNHFDFLSVLYAPNTFYYEENAIVRAPRGVVTITTTLPVSLPIRYERKPGRPGLTVLKSLFHTLELTRQNLAGKSSLTLFVTLDNSIVGTGHLEIGGYDLTTAVRSDNGLIQIARDGLPWPGVT